MKIILSILFIMTLALTGFSQADTVKTVKEYKQAPADLQKLIEEIKAEEAQKVSKDADIEIDGLLFDETKTKSGKDFYDFFYQGWEAPKNAKNYSIFITEKPYRLTTTLIEIKINETTVFQSFLQPRNDVVEQLAKQAVSRTQLYLANYEELLRQMEGEDQSGSGIF